MIFFKIRVKLLPLVFMVFLFYSSICKAQIDTSSQEINKKRLTAVIIGGGAMYVTSMSALWKLWFATSPSSSFHFVNDNNHWLQVDKFGHSYSAYIVSRVLNNGLKWSNVNDKKAAIISGMVGWTGTTTIDVMDGFSSKWGASYGDIIANTLGTGLFLFQELKFGEQKVKMKWSYYERGMEDHPASLLWEKDHTRWIHNYNAHTYWLSGNLWSFSRKSTKIPKWLNIAIGYSGINMLGEIRNPRELQGVSLEGVSRYRQFYFSLDIDPSRISTNSKFIKTILKPFEFIKFPFPAIEFNGLNQFEFYPFYF